MSKILDELTAIAQESGLYDMTNSNDKLIEQVRVHVTGCSGIILADRQASDIIHIVQADMKAKIAESERLCEIYFDIASNLIGENSVRRIRDKAIEKVK